MLRHLSILNAEFKADREKRQITGYASIFGNVDSGGDVVLPGAYTKTLSQDLPGGGIRVMRNHETLIGKPVHAEQDTKGLLTISQISKTSVGDDTLALAEDGALTGMSIGYIAEEKAYGEREGRKIRELKTLRLREWSFVDFPMNPDAGVVAVKSLDDVWRTLDAMQSCLYYLRGLTGVDPEIAARLRSLIAELGPMTRTDTYDAQSVAALSALVGEFQSYLTRS